MIASLIFSSCSVFILHYLRKFGIAIDPYYFLVDSNKLLALVTVITSFLYFKTIKIKNSNVINTIAGSTFGVLLIHGNSDVMRHFLWKNTFDNLYWYHTNYFFIHAIVAVFLVFAVCMCIDLTRRYLLERLIKDSIYRFTEKR